LPPVAAPPVYAAAPVAAAPPVAAASETQADDPRTPPHEETERALTLEEEMERLLHDFTIDVSERR
jgi:hypothetical protein